eukprot:UN28195
MCIFHLQKRINELYFQDLQFVDFQYLQIYDYFHHESNLQNLCYNVCLLNLEVGSN